jgi:hypothetical protein
MEWLTGPRPLISEDEQRWMFQCFEWLLRGSGGFGRFSLTIVVLPTDAFFPQRGLRFPELQLALLDQVKAHAGMSTWPCRLFMQEPDPSPVMSGSVIVQGMPSSPAGTFRRTPDGADISYSPALLRDPMAFVATMAHEMAHYSVSEIPEPHPGGEDAHEVATDMAAVFLGYGVFLLEAAYTVRTFGDARYHGWSTSRQGYLTEAQLLYALAVFTVLLEQEPREIARHLKSHYRPLYARAVRHLRTDHRLDTLRGVAPLVAADRTLPAPQLMTERSRAPFRAG